MIDVNNLEMRFPDKKLFENVSLKFNVGNTYGIIGPNGAGKSTFLKLLSSQLEPSKGNIHIEKNKRISILEQNHSIYDDFDVTTVVIMGNKELYEIKKEKDAIYMNPNSSSQDFEKAAELEEQYGLKGGWSADNDAQVLLSGLGIKEDKWKILMKDLKANEKVKVLVARALFGNPDILIMDEPTNHLDLRAIKWLENFLVDYSNLVIVVSHDSDFLDQVCTHIVDIDFGGAKMFVGNYTFWKESSQLALELQQKTNQKLEEKKKKLEEFIARFSANASKSSQATSRKKTLEKINIEEIKPSNRKYPFINFELNREPGKQILKVNNLTYINKKGETLFQNLNFSIYKNEKVALVGQNNIAKTKLLDILMNKMKPTSGSYEWGTTITPNYFPNNNLKYFDNNENILNWISKWPLENKLPENKDNSDFRMRSFLGRMLFSGESIFKKVKNTSGGEKGRLMFSKMMLKESNFLLFDQPLDHLDSESIDSFINSLKKYKSSCIFITYNRALINKVANVILELDDSNFSIFRGSLKEYEKKKGY